MRELICESCGVAQAYDSRPGARCLNCGGAIRAATRCYGCREVIPPNPKCGCGLLTVRMDEYEAAVMLAVRGTPLPKVRDRVRTLAPADRTKLEAEYRASQQALDDVLAELYPVLRRVMAPSMVEMTRKSYEQLRATMTPEQLIPSFREAIRTYRGLKPPASPWLHGISKAIVESAPLRLDALHWRLDHPRGLEDSDRDGLREHVEALTQSNPGDASFHWGIAYRSRMISRHALVLGELGEGVGELHDASRGREPAEGAVPTTLIRGRGVVWAVGPRPTFEIREPWIPDAFVYAPFEGPPVPLHELDGLRAFLRAERIPIEPLTLGPLLHWLLAPFPWDTAVNDEGIVDAWRGIEIEHANLEYTDNPASRAVGGKRKPKAERRDELVIRLEPKGTTLIYRPPELRVEGSVPSAKSVAAVERPAPVAKKSGEEIECGNCGVRRPYDPAVLCPNCGAPAGARTICHGCFEEIPPSPRCPKCRVPTLPRKLHALALLLRSDGVEVGVIAERARAVTPREREDLEARYAATWAPVDRAIEALPAALAGGFSPSLIRDTLRTYRLSRWTPGASPKELLASIEDFGRRMRGAPPSIAPFSLAVCKAIRESAPRRLSRWKPQRGLDADERESILDGAGHHSREEEDAEWSVRAEYLRELYFHHVFIAGEMHAASDPAPVFELAKHGPGIPVTVVRGRGIVFAQGPEPTADVRQPWVPTGFVFESIPLHEIDGLRTFLRRIAPPIHPGTLPFLLHWLHAPFPWNAAAEEETGLIEKWVDRRKPAPAAPELRLRIGGTTVVYRPPDLEIRQTSP